MAYNKPEIIAGNMEERESFSCGCPTNSTYPCVGICKLDN